MCSGLLTTVGSKQETLTREIAWPAKGTGDLAANSRLQPTPADRQQRCSHVAHPQGFQQRAALVRDISIFRPWLGPTHGAVKPPTSAMNENWPFSGLCRLRPAADMRSHGLGPG